MSEQAGSWDDETSSSGGPGGLPVEPIRLWHSVRSGFRWVYIGGLLGAGLATLFALFVMAHVYQTEAVLIYEPREGTGSLAELSTLVGMFTLPEQLKKVGAELGSKETPKKLGKRLDIWLESGSALVTVQARGSTAESAAKLANVSIDIFLEEQVTLSRTRSSESSTVLQRDLDKAQKALLDIRREADAFRAEHGIVDFTAEFTAAQADVAALKQTLAQGRAEDQALGARTSELAQLARKSPAMRVQSATRSDPRARRVQELRSQLASLSARLAPDHPQLAQLRAQIASLEAQKGDTPVVSDVVSTANPEVAALRASLSGAKLDRAALRERVKVLEDSLKAAEARLSKLSGIEADARKHIRELEDAEQLVRELRSELSRTRAEASRPDFRIVSRATPPPWPERSKRRIVAAAGGVLGVLLVLGWLIIRPLRDARVHTAREAAFWSKVPVVASTAWPRDDALFQRFIEELNDHTARSRGATLLVSAANGRVALASDLADALAQLTDGASAAPEAAAPERSGGGSTALVKATGSAIELEASFHAWRGALQGQDLRRACRLADRVVVLVESGKESVGRLMQLKTLLGREDGIGLVMLSMPPSLLDSPDRVGDVDAFWAA